MPAMSIMTSSSELGCRFVSQHQSAVHRVQEGPVIRRTVAALTEVTPPPPVLNAGESTRSTCTIASIRRDITCVGGILFLDVAEEDPKAHVPVLSIIVVYVEVRDDVENYNIYLYIDR